MGRGMALTKYRPKKCVICGKNFEPKSGHVLTCSADCAKKHHMYLKNKWRSEHANYLKRKRRLDKDRTNQLRRKRRKRIQSEWGVVGGLKGTWLNRHWEKAEEYAGRAITLSGWCEVRRLAYFTTCVFDIRASSFSSQSCVFMVTCRTHIDDLKRHERLADDLGLELFVIYVKPDLSGYIIKNSREKGADEINLKDLSGVTLLE